MTDENAHAGVHWGLSIDRSVPPEEFIPKLAESLGCTMMEANISYWINLLMADLMAVNHAAFALNQAIGHDDPYPIEVRLAQAMLMMAGSQAQTSIDQARAAIEEAVVEGSDVDEFLSDLFRDQEPG